MELFVPNILTVKPVNIVEADKQAVFKVDNISAPSDNYFKKIYFEELSKNCYIENGNFDSLLNVARIHHEEYFGAGGSKISRWKIYFTNYNILINIEEDEGGRLFVKAA